MLRLRRFILIPLSYPSGESVVVDLRRNNCAMWSTPIPYRTVGGSSMDTLDILRCRRVCPDGPRRSERAQNVVGEQSGASLRSRRFGRGPDRPYGHSRPAGDLGRRIAPEDPGQAASAGFGDDDEAGPQAVGRPGDGPAGMAGPDDGRPDREALVLQ